MLQRIRQMRRVHLLASRQIGYRAHELEHPPIPSGRQVHLPIAASSLQTCRTSPTRISALQTTLIESIFALRLSDERLFDC
jgi:hypothetical protein